MVGGAPGRSLGIHEPHNTDHAVLILTSDTRHHPPFHTHPPLE